MNLFRYLPLLLLVSQAAVAQNREVLGEYKIGIIGRDREEAIYQAASLGARDAARELSEQYSIDVELLDATPTPSQGGTQATSMAELFIKDADGFLISPGSSEMVASTIEFALGQQREIVFFEAELPGKESLLSILADEEAAGRMAAEAILRELPTRARVAVLTSNEPTPQLEQRLQGVRRVLGYRRIEAVVTTGPTYREAVRAIEEAEQADRNNVIQGWIFLEDWPLKGMPALPWQPGRKPVVAIQSSPSAFLYSERGYLDALIVHPYYEWGYLGVTRLIEKLHRDTAPEAPVVRTEPQRIDWRNFADYRENWKVWFR